MEKYLPIVLIIVGIVVVLLALAYILSGRIGRNDPVQKAGLDAEMVGTRIIKKALHADDTILTNIEISYDGKPSEMDNVIVNKYGVFIIEVKYYKGRLKGREDDYEWDKYNTTEANNTYVKKVKNPIVQVKRQIYILAGFLKEHNLQVWVRGYAFLLENNSPVDSEYILNSSSAIEKAIHTQDRKLLDRKTVNAIIELLSKHRRV